jgi:hypothetical protein
MNTVRHLAGIAYKLRYLNSQDGKLMGWFEVAGEATNTTEHDYEVYLALTGETVSDEYRYVASHQLHQGGGYFVVHAYD